MARAIPGSCSRTRASPIPTTSGIGAQRISRHPVLETWQAGSPDDVDAASRILSQGHYSAGANLGLESMYPVMLGYKDSVSVGWKFNFSDRILLDSLNITGAYSIDGDLPSDERPNVMIDYTHTVISASPLAGTWSFGAALNGADFYDLVGPTKRSRKGNRFTVGYEKTLLSVFRCRSGTHQSGCATRSAALTVKSKIRLRTFISAVSTSPGHDPRCSPAT